MAHFKKTKNQYSEQNIQVPTDHGELKYKEMNNCTGPHSKST